MINDVIQGTPATLANTILLVRYESGAGTLQGGIKVVFCITLYPLSNCRGYFVLRMIALQYRLIRAQIKIQYLESFTIQPPSSLFSVPCDNTTASSLVSGRLPLSQLSQHQEYRHCNGHFGSDSGNKQQVSPFSSYIISFHNAGGCVETSH